MTIVLGLPDLAWLSSFLQTKQKFFEPFSYSIVINCSFNFCSINVFGLFSLNSWSISFWIRLCCGGSPWWVMAKVLVCDIIGSKFKLLLGYYVHFLTNTLGKCYIDKHMVARYNGQTRGMDLISFIFKWIKFGMSEKIQALFFHQIWVRRWEGLSFLNWLSSIRYGSGGEWVLVILGQLVCYLWHSVWCGLVSYKQSCLVLKCGA